MSDPTPDPIVAHALAFAAAVSAWATTHRQASLAEIETEVLRQARGMLGPVTGAVLERSRRLDEPVARRLRMPCPGCGRRLKPHAWRERVGLTRCGATPYQRGYFWCRRCHQGWCPTDEALELPASARQSAAVTWWQTWLGGRLSFREAQTVLDGLAGLGVGAETVRSHTEQAGQALVTAAAQAAAYVLAEQEAAGPVEAAPGLLVVEADGVMLAYLDGWHEAKIGLVAGCTPAEPGLAGEQPGAHRLEAASYVAQRADAETFGGLLLAEAARRGALEVVGWEHGWEASPGEPPRDLPLGLAEAPSLAVLRPVQVLGDGAPWIWNLAAAHFGQERVEVVDWYHATEHLWTLGRALHGDGTPATSAWVAQTTTLLWEGGAPPLLALLRGTTASTTEAAQVLQRETRYFTTNAARMDYPAVRARGLPVGSGAIESAAKHLVQRRMKRAGMRWSDAGGQALLAVCAHLASGHLTGTPDDTLLPQAA